MERFHFAAVTYPGEDREVAERSNVREKHVSVYVCNDICVCNEISLKTDSQIRSCLQASGDVLTSNELFY